MDTLKTLEKICFIIMFICIAFGLLLTVYFIWSDSGGIRGGDDQQIVKIWFTLATIFIASGITTTVSKNMRGKQ
jgi:uncharacterized membrane protein HdeD (DUF308 family)